MIPSTPAAPATPARDDAILPATRLVAAVVLPFLLAAFLILYIWPQHTGRLFAWEIASPLTAAWMGAGYLGGAYFFTRVLTERRWHRVGGGFLPIAAFTAAMLLATLLHWQTFDPAHWPFRVWLALYVVTPILVPALWVINKRRDPGAPETDDRLVPILLGRALFVAGLLMAAGALFLLLAPAAAAKVWPWPLTPLTARVLAGWQVLLAVGMLAISPERRWSAWRVPLHTILIWQGGLLLAFVLRGDAFGPAGRLNWFTLYSLAGFLALVALLIFMERRRRTVA